MGEHSTEGGSGALLVVGEALVDVVRRLEAGGTGLEESLALWERGEALADRCQQWLDGARERLEDAVAARREEDGAER